MSNKSIVVKLLFLFFFVGISSMAAIGIYSYYKAKKAILQRALEQLTSIRVIKKNEIEFFFIQEFKKINLFSETTFIKNICNTLNSPKNALNSNFKIVSNNINADHPVSFIVKKNDNFNFSVFKIFEDSLVKINDLKLTQILSDLAEKVLSRKVICVTDMILQSEFDTLPSLFIGTPANDNQNKNNCVVIFEISATEINNIMLEKSKENGLGYSGEAYLVGNNMLMRSNSRFIRNSVLRTIVNTVSVKKAFAGIMGTDIIRDYRNIKCLSSYGKLNVKDLDWIIIAEIDYDEAMLPIVSIRNDLILISLIIAIFIISIASIISRMIAQPLIRLKTAALKIAEGSHDIEIEVKSSDEIGMLTQAIIEMSEKLKEERKKRMTSIYDGQEIERTRISRELHDGLGQMMVALKFKLENILNNCDHKSAETIKKLSLNLSEIIEETRRISFNLAPAGLTEFGLVASLKTLCKETESSSGYEIEFNSYGNFDFLDSKKTTYIFRIVQEALSNAVRHSHAKHIAVQLIHNKNNLVLIIEDNGIGFTVNDSPSFSGNGLFNIKERVRLLDGSLSIESKDKEGTTIRIKIPIV